MYENDAYRLVVHQRTKIDKIREAIPKPPGSLPPNSLPAWEDLPLEQKLPLVPAPPGALYYSRGKLGKKLIRKPTGGFSTADPLNQERVPTNKYEILHDKSNSLQNREQVQKALKKFDLINDDGNVICSIKEFNRFRKYLASLHNDQVRAKFTEMDDLDSVHRKINHAVRTEEEFGERRAARAERTEKVKKFQEMRKLNTRHSFVQNQQRLEAQLAYFEEQRRQEHQIKTLQGQQKALFCEQRRIDLQEMDKERRRDILSRQTQKAVHAEAFKEQEDKDKKAAHEEKLTEWFEAKMAAAAERVDREKGIQSSFADQQKKKAERRQQRVEKFREELPLRIEKKKQEEKRLWDIVRKYAMRWLNRVRARLNKEDDGKHGSMWSSSGKNSLKDCIKYLYQQSGHTKMDDVVMNILKFKEALKAQMLLEGDSDEDEEEYEE